MIRSTTPVGRCTTCRKKQQQTKFNKQSNNKQTQFRLLLGREAGPGSVIKLRVAMDDVSAAAGGVGAILSLYDRLFDALERLGCNIGLVKIKIQVPVGSPSEELLTGAANRGVEVVVATLRL